MGCTCSAVACWSLLIARCCRGLGPNCRSSATDLLLASDQWLLALVRTTYTSFTHCSRSRSHLTEPGFNRQNQQQCLTTQSRRSPCGGLWPVTSRCGIGRAAVGIKSVPLLNSSVQYLHGPTQSAGGLMTTALLSPGRLYNALIILLCQVGCWNCCCCATNCCNTAVEQCCRPGRSGIITQPPCTLGSRAVHFTFGRLFQSHDMQPLLVPSACTQ